tara:strand:- start:130 stop:723 length:594 start_codon:yes stop_codon:yes gene_type:complete
MQVACYREQNLSYAVVDDYLTEKEYKEVLEEVKDLKRLSASPQIIKSATDSNSNYIKSGDGVFIDSLYINNRSASPVLCMGQKIFNSELCETLNKFDVVFSKILESNHDTMLLNYYSPGQVYKSHKDSCDVSVITLLGLGEFSGGGFCFPDQNVTVNFKQGRTIIFPASANHASEPLTGGTESCRVTAAHFIWNDGF